MTRQPAPQLTLFVATILSVACGGSDGGPDAGLDGSLDGGPDASDAAMDAPLDPDLVHVRYEPEGEGFYRFPWPSDARLTANGTPDLADFPNRRALLDESLAEIETHVFGYATMPVVYVHLLSPVADLSLPQGLDAMAEDSTLQLVDLSVESCGERFPLEVQFSADGDTLRPTNMLQVANAVGTLLTAGHPYGLVVLKSFGAPEGRTTPRPEAFDVALADTSATDPLATSLEPLRRCLPDAGVPLDEVALATVFTPQDPVRETVALRDFVVDPDEVATREITDWRVADGWTRRRLELTTHRATIQMPQFQDGETPYDSAGGALVFDEDGVPVVQGWEDVEIAVAQRVFETPPAGPRPVLIFMDGTGWEPWNHLPDNWIRAALDEGYVVMSFMPQFHGGRAGFEGSTEVSTFNVPNPPAARANFRQQAAETVFFVRLIREQIAGLAGLPELDTDHIVYGGHSQGALVGALVAGVDDQIDGYVLNGLSAFLTFTILFRNDFFDFAEIISLIYAFGGELDRFHPLLQMLQLAAEVTDTHNYVRRWHGWAGNPGGSNVFVVNGLRDRTTTRRGMDHLTMTASMPPIASAGWQVDPVGVWGRASVSVPVMGNELAMSGDPLTIATYLDSDTGHGTIYQRIFARQLAVGFWNTARVGVPRLAPTEEYLCGDELDGDGDGLLDCDDPDCDDRPPCVEGSCGNGVDEDGNGQTDCEDARCAGSFFCVETACADGDDNDSDGLRDCSDPDCARIAPCGEGSCSDNIDGDGDGDLDCADSDCADSRSCHETRCTDGLDDDDDGDVDCADDECRTSPACGEASCTDGSDENDNGLTDCADPSCAEDAACTVTHESMCSNGTDDDGDGDADCADADCALVAACAATTCADGDLGRQLGTALYRGTLEGAGNDYPPGDCISLGGGDEAPDIALAWTAPAAGRYLVSTFGSAVDTVLSVLAPDCDPTAELACDDDDAPAATSALVVELAAGQSVVLVVGAYDGEDDAGDIVLHIVPAPR